MFVTIVLDGVGIGAQPDSGEFGDAGSHTLAHICETVSVRLPHLTELGLGCITPLRGVPAVENPRADYGKMREVSAGKDSTTGHWELSGIVLQRPFPTYPEGFPEEVINAFTSGTGFRGVLGNKTASGTDIISELGEAHQQTGFPIVYTSADSVFQVAAHVDTIPLDELYRICRFAREEVFTGVHAAGRVIARPFTGVPGAYTRLSDQRKDFSMRPPEQPVQKALQEKLVRTVAIGKIGELFDGVGFDRTCKTRSNLQGIENTLDQMKAAATDGKPTFIWTNLVDFDQEYGHRNDPEGFARALEEFDRALPDLLALVPEGGRMVLTADHGNDPITPSTDHSREYVPLLVYGGGTGINLGTRDSFADHSATVAEFFDVAFDRSGKSFLNPALSGR